MQNSLEKYKIYGTNLTINPLVQINVHSTATHFNSSEDQQCE